MNKKVRRPTKIDKMVGEKLKELRGKRSHKAFAERMGVNEEQLPQWEEGTLQPGKVMLCLIARKNPEPMTIKDFFDGELPPRNYPN